MIKLTEIGSGTRDGELQAFRSVAVVGAAGQVGELFARTLAPVVPVQAVVRERRWRDEVVGIGFHTDIGKMLEMEPEVVILAIPNPVDRVLKEIAQHAQKPLTLILPQNGVEAVDRAEEILKDSRNQFTIVRASLFTNVSRDQDGNIVYNPKKNRIALAAVGADQDGSLEKAQKTFTKAGFVVRVQADYWRMEYTKLIANSWASTSTVTGLSPLRALLDSGILLSELRGLRDRFRIYEANGIQTADDLWSIGRLRWLSQLKTPYALALAPFIALLTVKERNNQPSAAGRQINQGVRFVEVDTYLHKVFIDLGKNQGLRSPVDEAMWDILRRHGRIKNGFSLTSMENKARKRLLRTAMDYETKEVFVESSPRVKRAAERVYRHFRKSLEVIGKEHLLPVGETLKKGKSVLVALNHRGHPDHTAIMEALEKELPEEAGQYPIYILAGMKFGKDWLSALFGRAYSHPVVHTLTKGDSEEVKWRAQIINRRADEVINELLQKPCILVVYLEGGRSKVFKDGKVQLQRGAIGGSKWITNSRIGLVLPGVIRGTEKMMGSKQIMLRPADLSIQFCESLEADQLRQEGAQIHDRETRDSYLTDRIMKIIAEKLPEDERGVYR